MGLFDFLSQASDTAEGAVQGAEQTATQIPIIGTALRAGGSVLTGSSDFSQLPVSDQLARTFLTLAVSRHPESLPGLLSAYQTQDAKTAIDRNVHLTSDQTQADWKKIVSENPDTDQRALFKQKMWGLYPSLRGYLPILDNKGQMVWPPTRSEQTAAQARTAISNAPPGYEASPTTKETETGGVETTTKYTKAKPGTGQTYPESFALSHWGDDIRAGRKIFVPSGTPFEGENWGHVELTEAGKAEAAGQTEFAKTQQKTIAEETPIGSGLQSPADIAAARKKEMTTFTAGAKEREQAGELGRLIASGEKYLIPEAFSSQQRPEGIAEGMESYLGNVAAGSRLNLANTARRDFLAMVARSLPSIATAAGVNRFNLNEIGMLQQTLADPRLSFDEAMQRWQDFKQEAMSRAAMPDSAFAPSGGLQKNPSVVGPPTPAATTGDAQLDAVLRRRKKKEQP